MDYLCYSKKIKKRNKQERKAHLYPKIKVHRKNSRQQRSPEKNHSQSQSALK